MANNANGKSPQDQATIFQKIAGHVGACLVPAAIDHLLDLKICHYDKSADPARAECSRRRG